jgi:site-specific recombinase XerD
VKVSQAAMRFIRYCRDERHLSRNTLDAYRQDLAEFVRWAATDRSVFSITPGEILAFRWHLQKSRGLAAATVKRRMTTLRSMYGWIARRLKKMKSPFDSLDLQIRLPERLPRCLSSQEAARLLAHGDALGSGIALAVGLMLSTGIRVGELVRLSVADVDAVNGRVTVWGKGSRERVVFFFNERLRRRVSDLFAEKRGRAFKVKSRLILTSRGRPASTSFIRRGLSRLAKVAGIDRRVTPHMLRHTAATLLLETGTDIRYIQRLLGHRSILTTQIYAHVTDNALRNELARADVLTRLEAADHA